MLAKVDDNVREFLLSQPESGMGYQLVQTSGSGNRLLIMNAELCINLEHMHELAGYQDQDGRIIVDGDIQVIDIEPKSITVNTHGSFRSNSRKGEVFVRYSAFRNDIRIRRDGSIVSGSYVTTENEALHWGRPFGWTGLSVVGRYALPNPAPAIYRTWLKPTLILPISCGTVAPNYSQSGGGVEVRFEQDTPSGTVIQTDAIPDR